MELNVKEIATASMVLFAVIDIIGSIPIIIDLRQKVGHIQSEKASVVALIIMVMFLFVGVQILNLIGIETMLTGIRADLAIDVINTGIDFSKLNTFGTVQQAIMAYGK